MNPPPDLRPRRPVLVTALRPTWRGRASMQFGTDPARAVVVDGVDEPSARLLLGLDGGRTEDEVLIDAAAARLDVAAMAGLIAELRRSGLLTDAPDLSWPLDELRQSPAVTRRLAPDLASLALLAADRAADHAAGDTGDGPGATPVSPAADARDDPSGAPPPGDDPAGSDVLTAEDVLRGRRRAAVVVHGAGRVGATLAALLGAAGVGHVQVVDTGAVSPADLAPGGIAAADTYRSRATAAADAVRRAAPEARTAQLTATRSPDLVVIASTRPVDTDLAAALHAARIPHLLAGVRETTAIIGPLVDPGRTSCLRCADLHRADRDPAWPAMAAQLAGPRRAGDEACDVALATVAAALAALQALAHLAGDRSVPTRAGALELTLSDWRLRRRGWPPHRRCGCGGWEATSARRPPRGEWVP